MKFYSYSASDSPALPERREFSNKGTYGRLLCICGSRGMSGAAYLCAKAAYRTGAGLVEILTCEENRIILQTLLPEAVITTYDAADPDTATVREAVRRADAVTVGCGLGKSDAALKVLTTALKAIGCPAVIDADALNLLAENNSRMYLAAGHIITPHPAEMNRLGGLSDSELSILKDCSDGEKRREILASAARGFAKKYSLVCVLKDHRTVVSDGGDSVYINTSGNSGMATGGSGDVLAGITGGLLAQTRGGNMSETATLSVYLHGLAGDTAAEKLGEYSVMASDIIDGIPDAIKTLRNRLSN